MSNNNLEIIKDNKWKYFRYRYEVPRKVLKEQFDHLSEEEYLDNFFKYKKVWYHISDFMRLENNVPKEFKNYDGYSSDSFFSGVLIKLSEDGERYKIATYIY